MLEEFLNVNQDILLKDTSLKGINSINQEFISKYFLDQVLDINSSLK